MNYTARFTELRGFEPSEGWSSIFLLLRRLLSSRPGICISDPRASPAGELACLFPCIAKAHPGSQFEAMVICLIDAKRGKPWQRLPVDLNLPANPSYAAAQRTLALDLFSRMKHAGQGGSGFACELQSRAQISARTPWSFESRYSQ